MGRRNPLKAKLDPENWKELVSAELDERYPPSDINSADLRKEHFRILEHGSLEDAVKRIVIAGRPNGADAEFILDVIHECWKSSRPRQGVPPEKILRRDIADLKRIERKMRRLISVGIDPEFYATWGRKISFPHRTYSNAQIFECLAEAEATLRYAISIQGKRNSGRPANVRKRELARNLESLIREELKQPLYAAIGDCVKAAFEDPTKWPGKRVQSLLRNSGV